MQMIKSTTHTTNLVRQNEISQIVATSFLQNQKIHTLFDVIAIKHVDIMFKKKIDNIKGGNNNYVMSSLYACSDVKNRTSYYYPLSLKTRVTKVCGGSKYNWV